MSYGLTQREAELLGFLREFIKAHTYAPSFEDMMDALGLQSKSGIHRILTALEERGHIHRLKARARSIEMGPAPEPIVCAHCRAVLVAA